MHFIPRLDLMIAYSCNIKCIGCISLSDWPRRGVESYDNIVRYLDEWYSLISPQVITIFGGEPCLHPKLIDICLSVQERWPNSTIRLITNGYLLDNFNPIDWFKINNFEMQVSIHRKDHEPVINQKIKNILNVVKPWKVEVFRDNDHKQISWTYKNFMIYKSIFKDFVIPYRTVEGKITTYNSIPEEAHSICGSPATPILYKGLLYKCPPVANIADLDPSFQSKYQGLSPNDNIDSFVLNIGKPESICGNCPDKKTATVINHFDIKNVIVKQKIFN